MLGCVSVAVQLSLRVADRAIAVDGDLRAAIEAVRSELEGDPLPGRIVILASDGAEACIDDDDLEFTVQQLLEGIPELAAGRPFGVGFSEAPGAVTLTPEDGMLRITAEYFEPVMVPTMELLPALLGCCERFIALARAVYAERLDAQERIAQLDPWVVAARGALAA